MKTSSLSLSTAAAALLAVAIVAASTAAQAPQQPQGGPPPGGPGGGPPRQFPAPTNLKVLPKNLTGQQVREIMEGWSGQLGVHCNACHAAQPGGAGPNGWPRLNFPDDSKPEKNAARLMFTMTKDINENTISMVDEGKGKVTCGTCHRGHLKPEDFVPPPEEDHRQPPPGTQPPAPK